MSQDLSIAVVDDETEYQDQLCSNLELYLSESRIHANISCFSNAEDFLASLNKTLYSVIFMDIYMKDHNGVDVAMKLRAEDNDCPLVFCTSSSDHMPEAFSCHAFDYIVKPSTYERIKKIMDDLMKVLPDIRRYITIENGKVSVSLLHSEIIYVTTSGHYLHIVTQHRGDYTIRQTMPDFISQLDDSDFLLVNRGILVNMNHISNISGTHCILNDKTDLPVKTRSSAEIAQKWQDFLFRNLRQYRDVSPH
ncbi:MAG: response regulator transcription factor [Eubacterium sp.]|nr:response regulator transcription factor [Eubacterium sp.]